MVNGKEGDVMPFPATEEVLERGQERFNIYCTPCHSRIGDGNGMIVQRGYRRPPSYQEPKLLNAPIGHFYDVMTNGFGAMPDYAAQVTPHDRWAIAAYIRALQLSQRAPQPWQPGQTIDRAHRRHREAARLAAQTTAWRGNRQCTRTHKIELETLRLTRRRRYCTRVAAARGRGWPVRSSLHRRLSSSIRGQAMQAYLVGFMLFTLGLTLGSLGWLMLWYMTGGRWGLPMRRIWEAATRNILAAQSLSFIPIAARLQIHLFRGRSRERAR